MLVSERVKEIISEQFSLKPEILKDSEFYKKAFETDLGADSIGLVELMMKLEEEFNADIPENISEKIRTVGQAYDCVNNYYSGDKFECDELTFSDYKKPDLKNN